MFCVPKPLLILKKSPEIAINSSSKISFGIFEKYCFVASETAFFVALFLRLLNNPILTSFIPVFKYAVSGAINEVKPSAKAKLKP